MYYGFVESGKDKDPAIININMSKIKQESNSDDAVISAAITIAHEKGHITSYNDSQGFVGGEAPAEQEERRVASWIKQNYSLIQDLL
jgi:Cu2+-containing amine oxidase